jgi:hypothetical protein
MPFCIRFKKYVIYVTFKDKNVTGPTNNCKTLFTASEQVDPF